MYVHQPVNKSILETQIDDLLKKDNKSNIYVNTNEFDYTFLKICYPNKTYLGKKDNNINVEYTIDGKLHISN